MAVACRTPPKFVVYGGSVRDADAIPTIVVDRTARAGASWAEVRTATRLTGKRAMDITGASCLLLVLLPILAIIAVLVRCSSTGPILFRQQRVGKGGRVFCLYKFRTMIDDSDPSSHEAYYRMLVAGCGERIGGVFKLANDPRITPIGRMLRRFSLDELPQLLNVLRGEMSLVGPRPPVPYEVELYGARERQRLSVTPGMTGLWQVSGRNMLSFQQMIDLDLVYIDRWSIWLDLLILLRTPVVVVTGRGAC
jgi:lipopolysaccharide/colanic/teichoic acid biosynthesis glycosyltransferase